MINPVLAASLLVGFDTLRANPLRTILSTLGIVIGVGALVSVLSIGDGMERLARDQIGKTTNLQRIVVTPRLARIVDGTPFPISNPVKFTVADAAALGPVVRDSASVNMLVNGAALATTRADTTAHATAIQGLLAPEGFIVDSLMFAGRAFTTAEAATGRPVVVLTYALAQSFAGTAPVTTIVGDTLLFQGEPRVVVGVLKGSENDRTKRAIMPMAAAFESMISGALDRPAVLIATATSVEGVASTRARVEGWAARNYGAAWKDRLSVVTDEARLAQVRRALLLFKLFMGALMSISLIVGGIGIMNVLLSSVIERTREIGIRKASGAAQRHILWQFLCESVAITGVGSVIGLMLGIAVAFGATAIMRHVANAPVRAWLSPSTVVVAMGASVLVGLTFGLYPAMRAARLSPIDAIHHE
jgi:putative ABC transport system permease protein